MCSSDLLRDDPVAAQDRHAVAAALVREEFPEGVVHGGQLAQPLRLVDALGPLDADVDLLERHDIRLLLSHHVMHVGISRNLLGFTDSLGAILEVSDVEDNNVDSTEVAVELTFTF